MSKKTEELEAEIEEILTKKRDNLKTELEADEEAKQKKEKEEQAKKAKDELREEVKKELMKDLNISKIIDTGETRGSVDNTGIRGEIMEFSETYKKMHGLTGKSYEDILKKLSYGEYSQ